MSRLSRLLTLLISVIIFCHLESVSLYAKVAIGLWVECQGSENSLGSLKNINEMLDDAQQMEVTDLFIQVHRGNRAWCKSTLADASPYESFVQKEKIDPVAHIINIAHKRGMRVHLWLNTFRLLRNIDAPIVKALGTKIFTRDGKRMLILDYPNEDLPDGSYWLDPGDLQVQDYLRRLIVEILDFYPDADGVHLDFIRYPYRIPFYPGTQWASGRTFGYGVDSVNRFTEQTGLDPFEMERNRENSQRWDDWKRDQVTLFVRSVHDMLQPRGTLFSVAGICWADRAYLSAYQDWRGWLKEGIIDFVASMNYTIDSTFAYYISREAIAAKEGQQAWIGLGAYLLTEKPDDLSRQLDDAVKLGADGLVIFSYDVIKSDSEIKQIIRTKSNHYNK